MPANIISSNKTDYLAAIEKGLESVKQRPFDRYVLGPFLIWYGLKSKKMPPLSRKFIVTAGIWQIFYSWRKYRELPQTITTNIQKLPEAFNINGPNT